jgi:hypothetical protein
MLKKLIFFLLLFPTLVFAQSGGAGPKITTEAQHPLKHNYTRIDGLSNWTNATIIAYPGNSTWGNATYLLLSGSNANQNINVSPYNFTAGQLNATASNISGILMPQLYNDTIDPNGFYNRTSSTFTWTDATRTLNLSGNHNIYIAGVNYAKTSFDKQISNVTGQHWVYYDNSGVLQEQVGSPGFQFPLIATIYWNNVTLKGLLGDERHGYKMDFITHGFLHNSVGVRYVSGLTGTFADTTFSILSGKIYDEDIDHSISNSTTCDVLYKNATADFQWIANQTKYYYEDGSSDINYNNGNNLAAVPANQYVAYWFFATNNPTIPIVSLMGQRVDTTLQNARNNNKYESLTLGTLPFQEMKLLYRVILRNDATPYEEAQDLRAVSNIPSGTYVASQHNALTGLNWASAGHTFDTDLDIGAYNFTTGNFTSGIIATGLTVGNANVASGIIIIKEDADDGGQFASFTVPPLSANTVYTLPTDDGNTGEVLSTNGLGALDWVSASAGSQTPWTQDINGAGFNITAIKNINFTGAISGGVVTGTTATFDTLNTGQGAYELYAMNQNVLTTSAVTFVTVDTGQGANELYDMDQNVMTTSDVSFSNITLTGRSGIIKATAGVLGNATPDSDYLFTKLGDLATTAPITGAANDIFPGADGTKATIAITVDKDLVTTAPLTGGTDNILTGSDSDITLALTLTGDIVATSPITINGTTSVDNIIPGGDTDFTIAIDAGKLNLKNQTKSISIYNITNSSDVLMWQTPKAITLSEVSMVCIGGTNVSGMLEECNGTGLSCVPVDVTGWTATGETVISTFSNGGIDAGDWLLWNSTVVQGTPSNFAVNVKFDE